MEDRPLTPISAQVLRGIHDKATKGDWYAVGSAVKHLHGLFYWPLADDGEDHNAQAIAMYHNNFTRLLDTIIDLKSRLSAAESEQANCADALNKLSLAFTEKNERVRELEARLSAASPLIEALDAYKAACKTARERDYDMESTNAQNWAFERLFSSVDDFVHERHLKARDSQPLPGAPEEV